jgi:hypothetical protein
VGFVGIEVDSVIVVIVVIRPIGNGVEAMLVVGGGMLLFVFGKLVVLRKLAYR